MRFLVVCVFKRSSRNPLLTVEWGESEVGAILITLADFGQVVMRPADPRRRSATFEVTVPIKPTSEREFAREMKETVFWNLSGLVRRVSVSVAPDADGPDRIHGGESRVEHLTRSAAKAILYADPRVMALADSDDGISVTLDLSTRSNSLMVGSLVGSLFLRGVQAEAVDDSRWGVPSWHLLVPVASFTEDPATGPEATGLWTRTDADEISFHGVGLTRDPATGAVTVTLPADRRVLLRPEGAPS